jgi:hypothetical protein
MPTFMSSKLFDSKLILLALVVLFANFKQIDNFNRISLLDSVDSLSSSRQQQSVIVNLSHNSKRNANSSSSSSYSKKESILNSIKQNNHKVIALVDKSVTLSCAIDLDDKNFSKSENYKVS